MTSLLILDSGSRVPLIRRFVEDSRKYEKCIRIIAGDCSKTAPALYVADDMVILPRVDEKSYISDLIRECKNKQVEMIIPLWEEDLIKISKNKNIIENEGIKCLVSDHRTISLCQDKKKMNEFLKENKYSTIETVENMDEFKKKINKFPVIMKKKNGCGSKNIRIVNMKENLEKYFNSDEEYIVQPIIKGKEIGIDIYVDMISHQVVSIFAKEKLLMRNGETNKSISIKDKKLFDFIKQYVERLNFIGPIDIDLFEIDNKYFIFDVNPRFGGGYLHAHECNVKFTEMILNNLLGFENNVAIGEYDEGIMMMKYSDVKIVNIKDEENSYSND